ncbi:MAG: tyrosine-type recombinase/integrase [Pseudomonadota bacterium]
MALTDRFIRHLAVDKRQVIPDESHRHGKARKGLVLIASTKGAQHHTFHYIRMVRGKRFSFRLGDFSELSLAEARELVDDINDYEGTPAEAWEAIRPQPEIPETVLTVERLINKYIDEEACRYNRDWRNQQMVLKRELKPYHQLPADKLTTDNVLDVVQGCLDRGSPRSAQEALKQIKSMYNWAMGIKRVRRQEVSREEATHALVRKVLIDIPRNPADGVIAPKHKARTHHLEGKALTGFLDRLRASDLRNDCKLILELQLQAFARVGEVAGMQWAELDLSKRVWVIPGARYKTGRDHTVMLSTHTAKLLRKLQRQSEEGAEYVFPRPRGGALSASDVGKAINKARDSLKQHEAFSSHSLRHSGATWLASQHCPLEVRERLLGHVVDNDTDMSQRYQHHQFIQERKEWTQRWCDFLEGVE